MPSLATDNPPKRNEDSPSVQIEVGSSRGSPVQVKNLNFRLQLKALMTKSALVQKRQYRTNICQILFPLLMILLLWLIQRLVDDIIADTWGTSIPAVFHPVRQQGYLVYFNKEAEECNEFKATQLDPDLGRLLVATNGQPDIGNVSNAPNGPGILGKVMLPAQGPRSSGILALGGRRFYDRGGAPTTICSRQPRLISQLNVFSESSTAAAQQRLYAAWADPSDQLLGGYEFTAVDGAAKQVKYNVMVNDTFAQLQDIPALLSLMNNAIFRYLRSESGVTLGIQDQITMAATKGFPSEEKPIEFDLISLIGPSIFNYIFFLLMPVFLGNLVSEKENLLRDIMRMMGLKTMTYWIVTYTFNFVMYIIAVAFMIGIAALLHFRFFTVNSFSVYFILFFIWGNVLCALAALLSVFFEKSRTATVVGYLVVFGSGMIAGSLITNFFESDVSDATLFFIQLWPPFAFYRGMLDLKDGVAFGSPGLTMTDLSSPDVHLDAVYIYLTVEWFVILLLAIYLEQIWPSKTGGVKKPPLFFLDYFRKSASTIASASHNHQKQEDSDYKEGDDVEQQRRLAEQEYGESDSLIRIQKLRKVFPGANNGSDLVAVKDLSMVINYGQCVGFLGSNGAGKSTTISMLCGYHAPTSGTAKIFGQDLVRDIDIIHNFMGVCPQENVLWLDLTGGEHLAFYGRLKGLDGDSLEQAVVSGLKSVELLQVRNKKSGEYSGGMKRRLCVAISLIGDPKVVLMDEPTTGLDPASRQGLWKVISERKKHCAMLLTTHSMEEAESLCDVLGIFERGRLRCMGTSSDLKHRFENGYKITVYCESGHEKVMALVQSLVSGARLLNSIGKTSNFEVPCASTKLSTVFTEIEKAKDRLKITDWGISNTTLDEVFVRIATGQHNKKIKPQSPENKED